MPIINIKDLEIGYNKKTIAKNITFKVEENSCTCIFGENECKNTKEPKISIFYRGFRAKSIRKNSKANNRWANSPPVDLPHFTRKDNFT